MKTKTETRMVSKGWDKILPVRGYPKVRYKETINIDKMIKDMGWKQNGRRTS